MFDNLRESMDEETKKNLKIALILLIIFISFMIIFNLFFKKDKNSPLEAMKVIGKEYYEKHYYIDRDEKEKYYARLSKDGFIVNLNRLIIRTGYKNYKLFKEKKCNLTTSSIKFTPKEPYQKGDYKMDVSLDCKKK